MLVLTRKLGERIVIADNIVVSIVEIKGDNVRVAIDAPKEIKIYRAELYDAIADENAQAIVPVGLKDIDIFKDIYKKK